MNKKQKWIVQTWLALVAVLALFPPFEVSTKGGTMQLPLETNTRHGFVLHHEDALIEIGLNGRLTTTAINLPALLCELLALTAFVGILFISVKEN